MATVSSEELSKVFVEVADTLVGEFDVIEFLQMVVTHTSGLVRARAVGVLLADSDGRLQLMAASDEHAELLELFQLQVDEGPCLDCYRTGTAVLNADLESAADRWPRFAPRAVAVGYRSVHAFPLRLRDHVIGALNLFGTNVGELADSDVRVIQALADVATIGLLQERAVRRADVVSEQLQSAFDRRMVIEQAKGGLAQIHGTSPDVVFEMLRSYCRRNRLRLSDVAFEFVADPTRFPELTKPRAFRS